MIQELNKVVTTAGTRAEQGLDNSLTRVGQQLSKGWYNSCTKDDATA
jgi:hypothetical protein